MAFRALVARSISFVRPYLGFVRMHKSKRTGTYISSPKTMSPTVGPTPPLQTLPIAACHTTLLPETGSPPKHPQQQKEHATTKGLLHAGNVVLDARRYKSSAFAQDVVQLLATLGVATWTPALSPEAVTIVKVSGSLTNAVFFISHATAHTVLLRIYGPSSGELISRPHELHILHVLSSQYGIGPRVYGTFANGRVEEYFASEPLTVRTIRDLTISAWVGMRMAELHMVDLKLVEAKGDGLEREVVVRRNVRRWLGPAREVVRRGCERGYPGLEEVDLDAFEADWERYWAWLMEWERKHGASPRVFAHNDAQYGNLLQLKNVSGEEPAHHKIIVVDFEYAGRNAAAFDIANHFHEWTADYVGDAGHLLRRERYPGMGARKNFYVAYLRAARGGRMPTDEEVMWLDGAVAAWGVASDGMWGLWGLVQAAGEVAGEGRGELDYVGYGRSRLAAFGAAVRART